MFANSALSLIDFLFSGVLVRFPDLKLLYAEAQIGWIPYVLERVDDVWDVHRGWSESQRTRQRAAVAVLLPPGRELLLQGRRRGREPRPRRARQHRVRDRLPAPGQHVAEHAPGRQGAVRPARRRHRAQDRARQRHPLPRPRRPRRRQRSAARRDHPRSGGDDRRHRGGPARPPRTTARRARRARRPGRARRRQPGRGRPARRRLARLAPDGALPRPRARRPHQAR